MKSSYVTTLLACGLVSFVISACGRKTDPNKELEKAVAVLAKEEPAQAPAPASAPSAPTPQPAATDAAVAAPPPRPAQQLNEAMVSYKAGNLEDAVTRLQKLRATPAMSPQQRMALNDAMAAVMTEIYSHAEKGDARAIQAVKQYEQMQTSRH
jgi:hypothetical protein